MTDSAGSRSAACFACGEPVGAADSFCEACGTELTPITVSDGTNSGPAACESCPSSRISAEGYCESCGGKVLAGRDHEEADLQMVAGVTDRGMRHHRNEDAMALAVASTESGPAVVAVVCGGVSSSARPDEASLAAVQAAARALLTAVRAGDDPLTASPEALAEMALPGANDRPLGAARALVSLALDDGGTDNVTAVLAPCPPAHPAPPGPPSGPAGQP